MPDALTGRLARIALMAGVLAASLAGASPAGAAGTFSLSPTSGPTGTVVSVSGTGCAPGLLLSSVLDYVQIAATTVPPATAHLTVATDGSWHGTFTIPANAPAGPAAVTALCVSDGLQSLLTLYTPKTFTVTAPASSTTAPATTAPASPPTTIAPSGPPVGPVTTPTTTHPPATGTRTPVTTKPVSTSTPANDGSVVPALPGATPGANNGDATPPDASPASHGRSAAAGSDKKASAPANASAARGVYAADLSAPSTVGADAPGGPGGLGWLLWLLLAAGLLLLLAPFGWRWMRAADEAKES